MAFLLPTERCALDPFDVPAAPAAATPPVRLRDGWEEYERAAEDAAAAAAGSDCAKRAADERESSSDGAAIPKRLRTLPPGTLAAPKAPAEQGDLGSAADGIAALKPQLTAPHASDEALERACESGLRLLVDSCCVSPHHASRALLLLDLASLPEAAVLALSRAFGDAGCAGHAAAAFIRRGLLPRFQALGGRPATRGLLAAATGPLLSSHAGALLEALVLPLTLTTDAAAGPQAEALTRIAKQLPPPTLARLEALALKPPLSTEVLAALLCRADASADVMGSSLKFGNFVFTLVRSYLPLLGPHAAVARKVAASLTTFMGRNTLKLLDKI
ncbi:hypothetical protein EMIHUDRAFT_200300 [Emiliania huxleyi CCMP1516]|uniref:Fanconi Anaemia group E protein C-terminal domain-containing protein n=2 Tax=Emiliania huxleyi TaxID=2903 RepID=A0A0D3KVB7_EMIH1|nr:hypothetical protein EMIHUDRAFT_200300 [Emiliania huxleyi CCMP1516]EOD39702.1 hypothetical protein EMIHUDRAFT_200300 [Emiliania huxleyi CCMP1516]|eukprot:XP_005792131.1 hypothetical protein EMIHUDRAFT_200300 [Emiliania huxleyi CCMP1516]